MALQATSMLKVSAAPVNPLATREACSPFKTYILKPAALPINKAVRMELSPEQEPSLPKQICKHATILSAVIALGFGHVSGAGAETSLRQEGKNSALEKLQVAKDAAQGKFGDAGSALSGLVGEGAGQARSTDGSTFGKVDELKGKVAQQVGKAGEDASSQAQGIAGEARKVTGDLAVKADAIIPQQPGGVVGGAPTPDNVARASQSLVDEYGTREEKGGPSRAEEKLNSFFGGSPFGKVDEVKGQVEKTISKAGEDASSKAQGLAGEAQKVTGDLAAEPDSAKVDTVAQASKSILEEYNQREAKGGPSKAEEKLNSIFDPSRATEQVGEAVGGPVESLKGNLPGQ